MFTKPLMLTRSEQLTETPPSDCLYQEVFARNGKFRRAQRVGLDVLVPEDLNYRGNPTGIDATPFVRLHSRVPLALLGNTYSLFQQAMPREALMWFTWDAQSTEYALVFPVQIASEVSVVPVNRFHPMLEHVLIDLHSHNVMRAYFSSQDDRDEQSGFRIFAVVGCVNKQPQIRVRVGVFGCWMTVRPSQIFELPADFEEVT